MSGDDGLTGCTCFRLRRATRRITQVYDTHLAPANLTLTQYSLLSNLARITPPTMHELAEVMGMDRTTLTRNLKPLLDRGLLSQTCGADRRTKVIEMTVNGQTLLDSARALWRDAQDALQARLGDDAISDLHRLLDQSYEKLCDR